ncbi:Uncharacterized conserved protein YbjT, contains NAD(P)-binding and DUF2867 domains [Rhizobium sp. RU35A]|uniref:NAD-dependent epimerase/dehydratase family protein n=1 Tax=Rhizobium straminoryzae TaxID=1387186 RepID=A0A549T3I3_9HYPH|nr:MULTISPECIES: NmrA family NAD(P)-binding protein [Rhizobium]TRL36449.1 NAD-dependent epimerase/dehydratase family protein [Rhizobium straminoryzae]SIQ95938.1 Uncharacterized conserved protein YbjT, contains NAD(P)-binding and DUF2867 domains [Rhizobium sp. RU35A]
MAHTILVTGATGRLGQLVTRRLLDIGDRVRVLTRRPEEAVRLWGDQVDIAEGDFEDPRSLQVALRRVDRLFLLSPISQNLAAHQTALIDAAAEAGVSSIVKLSGSTWTIDNSARSIAGAQHRAAEAHLSARGIGHVILRPNAWMQVSLAPVVVAALSGRDLPNRYAGAAVSFIDVHDIAEVAARLLHAGTSVSGPQVLTGSRAYTARDVAGLVSTILRRPVGIEAGAGAPSPHGGDAFATRAVAEFATLIAEGLAAPVTETVERLLGRRPASLRHFLERQLAPLHTQAPRAAQGETQWQ